jgi:hypothetical protein
MLVPNEDKSMASERLARAHRTSLAELGSLASSSFAVDTICRPNAVGVHRGEIMETSFSIFTNLALAKMRR